ncbi:MAG: GNAT family N-acetyltransferase [Woeseiaceae bacterium]|nr:GNAT family N-acetyltransferase [Woeseiaceae bacterium]
MKNELTVRRFLGKKGYQALRRDWQILAESVSLRSFYQHPAWFEAYFDRPSGFSDEIEFRCVYHGDRLLAVLPLIYRRRLWGLVSEATFPISVGLYMPDIVVADDADKHLIWDVMRNPAGPDKMPKWDVFAAKAVLDSSAIAGCIGHAAAGRSAESKADRCTFIDIINYEDAYKALKKKFRGNLNNARNRLEAHDSFEFLLITDSKDMDWAYEHFVELEMSGWKGKKENIKERYPAPAAIGLKNSKYLFYKNVVNEFAGISSAEICFLKVDGRTIGAQILLLLGETSYLLKTAFDESAKGYSPGHLMIDFALRRYSSEEAIKSLCLITDYEWFKYWNPRYINYADFRDCNTTVGGQLFGGVLKLRGLLKGI